MYLTRYFILLQAGQKTSFTDKAKAFAVKAIDHTSSALESAKQNVRYLPKKRLPHPACVMSMAVKASCSGLCGSVQASVTAVALAVPVHHSHLCPSFVGSSLLRVVPQAQL